MDRPLTDHEALKWLEKRSPHETTCSGLARAWNWNRMTATRRVLKWAQEGKLTCTESSDGKGILLTLLSTPEQGAHVVSEQAVSTPAHLLIQSEHPLLKPQNSAIEQADQAAVESEHPPAHVTHLGRGLSTLLSTPLLKSEHPLSRGKQEVSNVRSLDDYRRRDGLAVDLRTRMQELADEMRPKEEEAKPEPPVVPAPPLRDWRLWFFGSIASGCALAQVGLITWTSSGGDWTAMASAIPALIITAAYPFLTRGAINNRSWWQRPILAIAALGCFLFSLQGSVDFVLSRRDAHWAQEQAKVDAASRADGDLAELRHRRASLMQQAQDALSDPTCAKRPMPCRVRSGQLADQAAALAPTIQAAEQALIDRAGGIGANTHGAGIGRLIGLPSAVVRDVQGAVLAALIEILAMIGLGFQARRRP